MGHGGDGPADTSGSTLDRSKVHILLCDKDPQSGLQVTQMLQRCSYQVTCVKSAGQVMQVLDSSGSEVDLILAEVELPKEKGFKLLKHIVRQEQLQRIPVVMMSSQDEMELVVRCLKLGAVDFLLKPLRRNELLNLWTHTWRRRRMLGLTERHLMKGNLKVPFDLLVSETSESNNTNSTILFSDDTEDHKMTTIHTLGKFHDIESELSPLLELSLKPLMEVTMEVTSECGAGSIPSPPRKSELKVGLASAFLTYSKVNNQPIQRLVEVAHLDTTSITVQSAGFRPEMQSSHCENKDVSSENGCGQEPYSDSYGAPLEEHIAERLHNSWESNPCGKNDCEPGYREQSGSLVNRVPFHTDLLAGKFDCSGPFSQEGATGGPPPAHFLVGGMIGPVMPCPPPMLSPGVHMYQSLGTEDGFPAGVAAGIPSLPLPQGLNLTGTFSIYPFGLHMAASPQLGSFPSWHPAVANPMLERKLGQAERREAALNKFRLKRKDRCFEKKIRYASRKKLAEQRPRVKGQFVRRETDRDVTDCGALDDYEDDEDDQVLCDLGEGSSPESVAEDA
ncbi:hypothetical protein L7F22_036749 [Adiantum nelumboides]|nr:hypothetical protein [Adiantum nelumboides]